MVRIVLLGRPGDLKISSMLVSVLRQSGLKTGYLSRNCLQLEENEDETDFLVLDLGDCAELELTDCVLVFKKDFEKPKEMKIRCSGTAVVFSEDLQAVQTACECGMKAVTCGMLTKDTVTLTSRTSDSAVIALQRSIVLPDQTILEPIEIPVALSEDQDVYSTMAAAAVLLLIGQMDLLESLTI